MCACVCVCVCVCVASFVTTDGACQTDLGCERQKVGFLQKVSNNPRMRDARRREKEKARERKRRAGRYYFKGEHSMRLISPSRRMDNNDNVSTAAKKWVVFAKGKKYDAKVSANTTLPRRYNKNVFFSFLFLPSSAKSGSRGFGFSAEAMARRADARVGLADADGGGAALLFAGTPPLVVVAIEVW